MSYNLSLTWHVFLYSYHSTDSRGFPANMLMLCEHTSSFYVMASMFGKHGIVAMEIEVSRHEDGEEAVGSNECAVDDGVVVQLCCRRGIV